MSVPIHRRDWLKKNSLAALALGFALPSMGNEEGLLKNFGAAQGLLNLGANENPYGISPMAKEAILGMLGEANRYQFNVASLRDFEKQLAAYCKVGEDQVICTAGSGEALIRLARHFNKSNLVTATPTFAALPNTAKKIGTQVIEVPLTQAKVHDLPAMLQAMNKDTGLVYICNPANPSSTLLPSNELKAFCREASKNAVVVVDEAYIDFLDQPEEASVISLVNNHPNILVVRTFSKIHAMAGLRIGYTVGHPTLIDQLEGSFFTQSKMNISNLSITAAMASMNDPGYLMDCKRKNEAARNYTIKALAATGITCIPSHTNFIFFPLGNYPGNFAQDMLARKTIVRSENYADGKWARVSLGTKDEMQQFISIFREMLKSNPT